MTSFADTIPGPDSPDARYLIVDGFVDTVGSREDEKTAVVLNIKGGGTAIVPGIEWPMADYLRAMSGIDLTLHGVHPAEGKERVVDGGELKTSFQPSVSIVNWTNFLTNASLEKLDAERIRLESIMLEVSDRDTHDASATYDWLSDMIDEINESVVSRDLVQNVVRKFK